MSLTYKLYTGNVSVMSTGTFEAITATIDELLREAAMNWALKADSEARYPWRQHDARIYKERADAAQTAAQHLIERLPA